MKILIFLFVTTISTNLLIGQTPMVEGTGPITEKSNKAESNGPPLLILIGAAALRVYCQKTGKCPFVITDMPTGQAPPVGTESSPERIPLRPFVGGSGTPQVVAGSQSGYQSYNEGEIIALAPAGQYRYVASSRSYDLLNGIRVYPAKASGSSNGSDMDDFIREPLKANNYLKFQRSESLNIGGNSCTSRLYSGASPRTDETESVAFFVCGAGNYKLFFITVASGPNREFYDEQNRRIIKDIRMQ